MPVKKLTPVLFVEQIESVLSFWTPHLGFIKTIEVPVGDRLASSFFNKAAPRSCINPSPARQGCARSCRRGSQRTNISLR